MSNIVTVLITAAGTPSTPSYIDCIKNNYEKRRIRIVCCDKIDQSIMHYFADSFHILPPGNSKEYIKSLMKICKKEKVDVIIPCSGSEILSISKHIELLKSHNIVPAVSNLETVKKVMDKYLIYKIFKKNNLPAPEFYLVKNKNEFLKAIKSLGYPKKPICFKPSKYTETGGERGFRILRRQNSLRKIILKRRPLSREIDYDSALRLFQSSKNHPLLVMEYLPGEMRVVYAFANKGKMIYDVHLLLQKRDESGHVFEAIVERSEELAQICKKIIKTLNFDFNVNIQFRLSQDGIPKLLEINPRIAGAIALPMAAGINLPYFAVKQALGEKLPNHKVKNGTRMIRYWKELYVKT